MKITLRSNISIGQISSLKDVVLETKAETVAALLDELSTTSKMEFFDRTTRELYPDCVIFLNGNCIVPENLNTRLKTGDRLEILMSVLGGG